MSDTTNQMSLLDAIGFSEPEAAEKPKKTRKQKPNEAAAADGGADLPAGIATPANKDTGTPVSSDSDDQSADQNTAEKQGAEKQRAEKQGIEPPVHASSGATVTGAPEDRGAGAPEALPLDKYLCFALYSANHAMHGVYKGLLKEIGLTYPQFLAMTVLWEKNNVPVGAITSKLQLDTNTLTPLLKRLEAMGLLTRTRSAKDERQVILKLTRKGRSLQKKTEHFSQCVFSSTGLGLEEVLELQTKIMRLRDNLRAVEST
ncbi:MarR family transcriptional regulator [Roseibium denhamense]|uniref:DNA-binding transcriptional regulator, MarR family n=1 Tax=Roseibium denhamense TaxID=76305 RepID=A0ABY1PGJ8_9HYPH|nr:MarR family transcriptional regulator [Roseibium denhamense]MTI04729.1 MarR family transcriptional regulator [Roseibium denhamense]SMP33644.1 DNA-binding transcriptional regulator, MarR family [Roseibium denhamense]